MTACTYNHRLEQTLQKAGSNRAELEKVLAHYKNDKKKSEAARFLLENMAECHTTVAPLIDSLKVLKRMITEHGMDTDWADSVDNAWKGKSYGVPRKIYDVEVITAQYLIENMETGSAEGKSTVFCGGTRLLCNGNRYLRQNIHI